jgi:hypothetical protein
MIGNRCTPAKENSMRRFLLGATVVLFALAVHAQTADDIIASYIRTIGGMQKIEAIKTLRRHGKYVGGSGFQATTREDNKRPSLVRQEFTFQGLTGVTAWNGKTGWKIEPWDGKKDAEPLGEEEMKSIIEDSDFDGPLIHYAEKGNKVEYLGTEPSTTSRRCARSHRRRSRILSSSWPPVPPCSASRHSVAG